MTRSIPTAFLIALAVTWSLLHVVLGISAIGLSTHPYANVPAMIINLALMTVVLFPPDGRIPVAMSPLLVLGTVVVAVLVLWGLPLEVWPGYAAWMQGSLEAFLITLAVRRRPKTALLACALLAVLILGWSTRTVAGLGTGLRLAVAPVVLTVIAVGLARFLALNDARAESQLRQALDLLDQAAAADTRRAEALSWARDVGTVAGRSLQLAANPDVDLTQADRARMVQVEASLRDRMRGGSLATPSVLATVTEARSRGVAVSLLDDRDAPLAAVTVESVAEALAGLAPRLHGGTLTVRARPVASGSPEVTIAYVPGESGAEAEYLAI